MKRSLVLQRVVTHASCYLCLLLPITAALTGPFPTGVASMCFSVMLLMACRGNNLLLARLVSLATAVAAVLATVAAAQLCMLVGSVEAVTAATGGGSSGGGGDGGSNEGGGPAMASSSRQDFFVNALRAVYIAIAVLYAGMAATCTATFVLYIRVERCVVYDPPPPPSHMLPPPALMFQNPVAPAVPASWEGAPAAGRGDGARAPHDNNKPVLLVFQPDGSRMLGV